MRVDSLAGLALGMTELINVGSELLAEFIGCNTFNLRLESVDLRQINHTVEHASLFGFLLSLHLGKNVAVMQHSVRELFHHVLLGEHAGDALLDEREREHLVDVGSLGAVKVEEMLDEHSHAIAILFRDLVEFTATDLTCESDWRAVD